MAVNGTILGTTNNMYMTSKIEWTATADSATTYTVEATLSIMKSSASTSGTAGTGTWYLRIGDSTTTFSVYKFFPANNTWVAVGTATKTGIAPGTLALAATGGISSTTYTSTSCSDTVALDSLWGPSELTVTGDTMGHPITIAITRDDPSLTDTITWSFGALTGTLKEKTGTDSFSWTPDISLSDEIPDISSGKCTLTVETFSGTDSLGTREVTFDLRIPTDAAPKFNVSASTSSPLSGTYVAGKSTADITFSDVTAKYGSSISSYSVSCNGIIDDTSPFSVENFIEGYNTITATVTDSRGLSTSSDISVYVYPYSAPIIRGYTIYRCGSDGVRNEDGTCIYVSIDPVWSSCGGANSLTCSLNWRLDEDSDWNTEALTGTSGILDIGLSPAVSAKFQVCVKDHVFGAVTVDGEISTADVAIHIKEGGKAMGIGTYVANAEDNTLTVSWDTTIDANLTVGDISSENLTVSSDVTAGGSVTAGGISAGSITATGDISTATLSVSGNISASNLETGGNAVIHGDLTVNGNISGLTNYITEAGETGIWKWRKWSDGTAECWGLLSCTSVACTASWGYMYESKATYGNVDYPFTFLEPPVQLLHVSKSDNGAAMIEPAFGPASSNTTTNTGYWYFYRPTSMSGLSPCVSIYAIGKVYVAPDTPTQPDGDTLEACSWANISAISKEGTAGTFWSVGDTKTFTVNGVTYTAAILDFDHDTDANGNTVGITFGMKNCLAAEYQWHTSNVNTNGWSSSIFTTLSGTILPTLNSDLKNVIIPVQKSITAGGSSTSLVSNNVSLWLLSEMELFGTSTKSTATGSQYPYYETSANRIKYLSDGSGSVDSWWLRSPLANTTAYSCCVSKTGTIDNWTSSTSCGLSFNFCV